MAKFMLYAVCFIEHIADADWIVEAQVVIFMIFSTLLDLRLFVRVHEIAAIGKRYGLSKVVKRHGLATVFATVVKRSRCATQSQ